MRAAVWAVLCASCLGGGGAFRSVCLQGSPYEDWLAGIGGEAKDLKDQRSRGPDAAVAAATASAGAELARAVPEALSGTHVVWIGDSVTRYQYLNMAYHVVHGAPPSFEFFEKAAHSGAPAWGMGDGEFWNYWYNWSNSQLQSPGTEETCDCWRAACCATTVENRYFSARLPRGAPVHMTYFQWFKFAMKGHWAPSDGYPIRTHCEPGECEPPSSFEIAGIEQFLREVAVEVRPRPTHVMMNRGAWGALSSASLEALFSAGRALSERHGIKFIWKTTLKNSGSVEAQQQQADLEARLARQHGWHVLDAWSAGLAGLHSYMIDGFHCEEAASAVLNWELLKML